MAIELITGAPGGGKSYHANDVHIRHNVVPPPVGLLRRLLLLLVPLLAWVLSRFGKTLPEHFGKGGWAPRLVITNIPVSLEEYERRWPGSSEYIQHREFNGKELETWMSDWRCPRTGLGPIFVVDEVADHLQKGFFTEEVHYLFRYHRHHGYHYVWLTQAEVSVDPRLRKLCSTMDEATNLEIIGFGGRYRVTRYSLVQGQRKGVIWKKVRRYRQDVFALYQSRTRGGGEGNNASLAGVKSPWLHPRFLVLYAFLALTAYLFITVNPLGKFLGGDEKPIEAPLHSVPAMTPQDAFSGPVSPSVTGYVLVGVMDGSLGLRRGSEPVWWSHHFTFEPLSGRCGIVLNGKEVLCGQALPRI